MWVCVEMAEESWRGPKVNLLLGLSPTPDELVDMLDPKLMGRHHQVVSAWPQKGSKPTGVSVRITCSRIAAAEGFVAAPIGFAEAHSLFVFANRFWSLLR